jgi:hypothetical protein
MRARKRIDSPSHIRSKGTKMEDPMSAAVAWDVATAPVRVPLRPARPRLVAVPCGDDLVAPRPTPLRLTRAGRLALTVTVTLAMLALVLGVTLALLPGGSTATVIDHSATVQAGQTLSEIAAQQLPQLPVADAVARIQVANDLPTNQVHAGQSLLIPAVG